MPLTKRHSGHVVTSLHLAIPAQPCPQGGRTAQRNASANQTTGTPISRCSWSAKRTFQRLSPCFRSKSRGYEPGTYRCAGVHAALPAACIATGDTPRAVFWLGASRRSSPPPARRRSAAARRWRSPERGEQSGCPPCGQRGEQCLLEVLIAVRESGPLVRWHLICPHCQTESLRCVGTIARQRSPPQRRA